MAAIGVVAVSNIRYAAPYHPTSSRALNWVDILGVATEMIVVSSDMRVVPSIRNAMMTISLRPVGYCDAFCAGSLICVRGRVPLVVPSSFAIVGGDPGQVESKEKEDTPEVEVVRQTSYCKSIVLSKGKGASLVFQDLQQNPLCGRLIEDAAR